MKSLRLHGQLPDASPARIGEVNRVSDEETRQLDVEVPEGETDGLMDTAWAAHSALLFLVFEHCLALEDAGILTRGDDQVEGEREPMRRGHQQDFFSTRRITLQGPRFVVNSLGGRLAL